MIVYRRTGADIPWTPGRDVWWHEAVSTASAECEALAVEADHPALIIYTSGTTGRPKGTVLTQGGFGIKNAHDWAYVFDMDDRAPHVLGHRPRLAHGADAHHGHAASRRDGGALRGHPRLSEARSPVGRSASAIASRISASRRRPRARSCRTAPTGSRKHDLSALRIIGSTGEPWNPEPFRWLLEHAGGGRVPIINYTGGTEISGGILASFPIAPIKPCSFSGPIPGMAAECFGEDGRPVRGAVGELVVTKPWPGMTKGFWQDPDRYIETYWSRWKDVWVHGDWAFVDDEGFWYIHGRSDDTLKIAGKRVGPAEVESVLVGDPAVNEAAAVGVPHEVKGESVVCFCVLRPGHEPTEALRAELIDRVAQAMGKALKPERVLFARELPKTRSAKIMRRVIRATYLGKDPGDLSSLDNPGGVTAISEAV